jgi:hypothetical protein
MLILLFYVISCYGITTILVQSKAVAPLRKSLDGTIIGELLKCMLCTGFWVGLLSPLLFGFTLVEYLSQIQFVSPWYPVAKYLINGFFVSGIVFLIYLFQLCLEKYAEAEL